MAQKLPTEMVDDAAAVFAAGKTAASDSATGVVELATDAETITGTDTARAVTPAGLQAKLHDAGVVTPFRFSAHKNGTDQASITTATWTKITFGTEVFDVGSYYDAGDSRFTPPADRPFHMEGLIAFTAGVVADNVVRVAIRKNGSTEVKTFYGQAAFAGTISVPVSGLLTGNGTDYFEIFAYAGGTGDKTVFGNATFTWFEAHSVD